MRAYHALAWVGVVGAMVMKLWSMAARPDRVADMTLSSSGTFFDYLSSYFLTSGEVGGLGSSSLLSKKAGESLILDIFLLAPPSPTTAGSIKDEIDKAIEDNGANSVSVNVYTQSDTLRCFTDSKLGGFLKSTVEPCNRLLCPDLECDETNLHKLNEKMAAYGNMFGDQFNQAWLSKEWGDIMEVLNESRAKAAVETVDITIYPTQVTKNPTMDKIGKQAVQEYLRGDVGALTWDPEKVTVNNGSETEGWKDIRPLLRQYFLWCHRKKGDVEAVFDLATVVDYVLMRDETKKKFSLGGQGMETAWCVQKPPAVEGADVRFKEMEMVYIDPNGTNGTEGHCDNANKSMLSTQDKGKVIVAIPPTKDFFLTWANGTFLPALQEVLHMPPGKLDQSQVPEGGENRRAVIFQDTLDADNVISVLYLLTKAKFQSVDLYSISQNANFKTHKFTVGAGRPWAFIEGDGAGTSRFVDLNPKNMPDVYVAHLNQTAPEGGQPPTVAGPAWPQLRVEKGGEVVPQELRDDVDTGLMQAHNIWRWLEYVRRFGLFGKEDHVYDTSNFRIHDGGVPTACPMSNAIVPYTFYFYNGSAPDDSNDFVHVLIYDSDEFHGRVQISRDKIHEDLKTSEYGTIISYPDNV